jgi:hypothetical protein
MINSDTPTQGSAKNKIISQQKLLDYLTRTWVFVALLGQWIFALYIFIAFGLAALTGDPTSANTSNMITGYIADDSVGNSMLLLHLLPAFVLSFCGIFQLLPYIRKHYPSIHKWNGRIFLSLGLSGAITGLSLTWVRGSRLSDIGSIGITLNGILIVIAIFFVWKFARKRKFAAHARWAIHAFILVNAVWTFRLYLMSWFIVNQGPNGNTANIDGPADIALSFACYLLPMFVAEVYFWAKRKHQGYPVVIANSLMLLGVLLTTLGVVAATMLMWLPRILA